MRRAAGAWTLLWALLLAAPGCDLNHLALVNSVPVDSDPSRNPTVDVFLAVDGLPHRLVQEMTARGDLEGWYAAPMISMFPSMSDASWTRILRAAPMPGPELHYYDLSTHRLQNGGLFGIVRHGVPPVPAFGVRNPGYYDGFDYFGEGYLDVVTSYGVPEEAYHESLDSLFYVLSRRVKTDRVFIAYVLEIDVMAHMKSREAVTGAFQYLLSRLSSFARRYPNRNIRFTMFSDHGNDFVRAEPSAAHFVDVPAEMQRLGVRPVERLPDGRTAGGLYAVPVVHTPVSYFAVHADPESAHMVGQKLSQSEYSDIVISIAPPDPDLPGGTELPWFAIWQQGREAFRFAYDRNGDGYYLPSAGPYVELGMAPPAGPPAGAGGKYVRLNDEQAFAHSATNDLPDLFFRTRTALQPIGMRYVPNVYFTFRRPYTSAGVKIVGIKDPATAGFHGNMRRDASYGVVLTQVRELPVAVRSDDFLNLFPEAAEHLAGKGMALQSDSFQLGLDYNQVNWAGVNP